MNTKKVNFNKKILPAISESKNVRCVIPIKFYIFAAL